jgi:threonine aldolase
VQFHLTDDADGMLTPEAVTAAISAADFHQPSVSLVCLENTHMAASGAPWSMSAMQAVVAAAGDLPVHLDGARLFYAEVATGIAAAEWAAQATTVMCCLSKGLAAPVGSLLAGSTQAMTQGRVERKRLGGGMRQAGVLAAPGLVALGQMIERLADDHARAARLADAVAGHWPDCGLDPASVRTNIVTFTHPDTDALLEHLAARGVRAGTIAPGVVRLVTHHDVDDAGMDRAIAALTSAGPGGKA